MINWQKVYFTKELYKAEIVKAVLEQNALFPVLINKKDSAYPDQVAGECEIYVHSENTLQAIKLIQDEIRFV